MQPVERLKDLVLGAAVGVYPPRQFRIGQVTSAARYPELADLRACHLQQIPEWFMTPKSRRSRFVKLMGKL
jgi:hypothetical protein